MELENGNTESVWAQQISNNKYLILNSPFYAYGLSYGDFVEVHQNGHDRLYTKTLKLSGNSTYRVFIKSGGQEEFNFYWGMLSALNCTYEKATSNLYAINVPPDTDIFKAYDILELGEKKDIWEFEEGHCGHPAIKGSTI